MGVWVEMEVEVTQVETVIEVRMGTKMWVRVLHRRESGGSWADIFMDMDMDMEGMLWIAVLGLRMVTVMVTVTVTVTIRFMLTDTDMDTGININSPVATQLNSTQQHLRARL